MFSDPVAHGWQEHWQGGRVRSPGPQWHIQVQKERVEKQWPINQAEPVGWVESSRPTEKECQWLVLRWVSQTRPTLHDFGLSAMEFPSASQARPTLHDFGLSALIQTGDPPAQGLYGADYEQHG